MKESTHYNVVGFFIIKETTNIMKLKVYYKLVRTSRVGNKHVPLLSLHWDRQNQMMIILFGFTLIFSFKLKPEPPIAYDQRLYNYKEVNEIFQMGVHEGKLREFYKRNPESFSESKLDYYILQSDMNVIHASKGKEPYYEPKEPVHEEQILLEASIGVPQRHHIMAGRWQCICNDRWNILCNSISESPLLAVQDAYNILKERGYKEITVPKPYFINEKGEINERCSF